MSIVTDRVDETAAAHGFSNNTYSHLYPYGVRSTFEP